MTAACLIVAAVSAEPRQIFICPMHPHVRVSSGGACPLCRMALVPVSQADGTYPVHMSFEPAAVRAGQPFRLRIGVMTPDASGPARRFVAVHERVFHLFVVGQDLSFFDHLHPELLPDGSLTATVVLPREGVYQLISDFLPEGGSPQLTVRMLVTGGFRDDPAKGRARLLPDVGDRESGGTRVRLQLPPGVGLVAGETQAFKLSLNDVATGRPVDDLEPFLGAPAHLLIVSADLLDAVHSHPSTRFSSMTGPDVVFEATFPRPGMYRMWAQFQRSGRTALVAFDVAVATAP
jgi:hypothetical protein